jgi:hypothetical protein
MGTSSWGHSPRLRDEQSRRDFEQERKPAVDEVAAYYAEIHRRELEDQRVKEDAFFAEQASRPAKRKAEEQRLLQERLLDIAYDAHAATSAERQRVNLLVKQYNGDHYMNPDVHIVKLLELRAILK